MHIHAVKFDVNCGWTFAPEKDSVKKLAGDYLSGILGVIALHLR